MRRPTVFLSAALGLLLFGYQASADTVSVQVSDGNDDAEELLSSGAIDLTSSDLELGEENAGSGDQLVGMRFASVAIPALATINSATLQFTVDEDDKTANPASYSIFGELSLNAASYTGASGEISARPRTVAAVAWPDVPSWTGQVGQTGPDQTSTDIAAVIQEVVNQGGWASGNSLALMLEPTTAGANRTAESYNGVPASAAMLNVDFTPIPEPSSVLLAALGLVSIATYGWRRRHN